MHIQKEFQLKLKYNCGGTEDDVTGGTNYADLNECVRMVKEAKIT